MDHLDKFIGRAFREVVRTTRSWDFVFDGGVQIVVKCLWRLTDDGRVQVTNLQQDDPCGSASAINTMLEVHRRLNGAACRAIDLRAGTFDLEVHFNTGHALQVIPDSAGYDAWYEANRSCFTVLSVGQY